MIKPSNLYLLASFLLTGCISTPATATASPTPSLPPCNQAGSNQIVAAGTVGTIGLYLPPCYDSAVGILYPVLYLLPGYGGTYQNWFDAGLASVADRLILSGEIPPLMIVTTDDTSEDLTAPFIVETLIPYIESHYCALPERSHRAIAGGSLGGASAYYVTFQHPDLFASAGVFGNGLVTGQEAQIEAWLQAIPPELKPRLFLNSGESDTYMLQQAKALIPLLDEYGIEHTEIFTPGGHSGDYWLSNFPAYFRWLAEDWK